MFTYIVPARVAELVDAMVSKTIGHLSVPVRFRPRVQYAPES